MTPFLALRRFDADEWATIREMRLAMLTADATAFDVDMAAAEQADEIAWRRWTTGDAQIPRAAWGVFQDFVCVGIIAAHAERGDCHVGALWVRPDMRGAGAARLLLDAAETWADDVRCSRVVLEVAD